MSATPTTSVFTVPLWDSSARNGGIDGCPRSGECCCGTCAVEVEDRNRFNGVAWSGCSALPGNAETQEGPAAVTYEGRIWLVIQSAAGDIFRRRYDGSSWSGWTEVPGDGSTSSGPAATVYKKRLWLFVRGTDNGIYFNRFQ